MEQRTVDIAIIGSGTAGLNALREAQKAGKSWVLIESGRYGTTCARTGCMPSKLLIAAAEAAHHARGIGEFGLRPGRVEVDGPAVLRRLRRERDRFTGAVVEDTEALPRAQRLCGLARFVDASAIEVVPQEDGDDPQTRVTFTAAVVAAGSAPQVPKIFEPVRHRLLTSETVFELEDLPATLAVIGTGSLGLELGQALGRLGVEVTFLDRSEHPGPFTDPKVIECVHQVLGKELALQMNATVVAAREQPDGVEIRWQCGDGPERARTFEAVLLAAGRAPNLDALNLTAAGLSLDERGMPPWDPETTRCGDSRIFLAGDVNGHRPLLHEAGDEGRISGENAARWPDVSPHARRTALGIVFCDPQMATVGASYETLEPDIRLGEVSFANQGRARVMAVNRGMLRVYARHRDCVIVGAELFCPRAEHMAHLLGWAIQEQTPVQRLLQMPVYHPTLEEGLRTALRDLARNLKVESECRSQDMTTAPGT